MKTFNFLLVLLIPIILLLRRRRRRGKKRRVVATTANRLCLPPSPWKLPLLGHLHHLVFSGGNLPHRSLRALAAAHGPIMLLHLGQVPTIVVSSAASAREVLQAQDHVFASRPSLTVPRRLLYGCTDIAFAPHGPYWRAARKMAVRHLLCPPMVRAHSAVREQEVAALLRRVVGEQPSVRLSELLNGFAKDVAGRIVLGLRAAGDDGWRGKVDTLLEESNALLAAFHVGDCVPWLSWVSAVDGTDGRVRRAFERIDRILDEILDTAASTASRGRKGDAAPETSSEWRLSIDNVKALLEDLFGAGTEATIIVLEWAMAELLRNKESMEKLQREVRQEAARARSATGSNHSNMVYLRAVIKETMRLHPPGPLLLPHKSMRATVIGGRHVVPSDTTVIVNAWAIGRDPEVWEESPEEFRPERFVGSKVDFRGQHFQLIPFGAGRRMCPGVNLAMSVVELALANLVARFDWALPEGEAPLDMEEMAGCTSRKKAPLRAIAMEHYCSPGFCF
ncbi:hypothetical protein HU200_033451 [Digitaria exilis]|uniref:Cytochrome P450 n=1 Tax=Digitaria exilis TaxID=1010633 RepID=A0A835BX79_9POAL|nr:hypothetical protein HU200_033451 [Digitaria exilis]